MDNLALLNYETNFNSFFPDINMYNKTNDEVIKTIGETIEETNSSIKSTEKGEPSTEKIEQSDPKKRKAEDEKSVSTKRSNNDPNIKLVSQAVANILKSSTFQLSEYAITREYLIVKLNKDIDKFTEVIIKISSKFVSLNNSIKSIQMILESSLVNPVGDKEREKAEHDVYRLYFKIGADPDKLIRNFQKMKAELKKMIVKDMGSRRFKKMNNKE